MTSPQIKVVILIQAASCLRAFFTALRRDRREAKLIEWIKANYAEEWRSLHWALRLNSGLAISHLHQNRFITDPYFINERKAIRRLLRDQVIPLVISLGAIGLLILGVKYWGWHW